MGGKSIVTNCRRNKPCLSLCRCICFKMVVVQCKMVSHHPVTAYTMYFYCYIFMSCRAEAVYQSMKSVYGTHACHMLQINSVNKTGSNPLPNLPDPWSQFIIPTSEDTLVSFYIVPPADWLIVSVSLPQAKLQEVVIGNKWRMWPQMHYNHTVHLNFLISHRC